MLFGDFENRLPLLSLDFISLGTAAVSCLESSGLFLLWLWVFLSPYQTSLGKGNQDLARLSDIPAKITTSRAGRALLGFMFSWENGGTGWKGRLSLKVMQETGC